MSKSTSDKEHAIVAVALDLAERNFEREYGDGDVGLIMPGAFAVSANGGELGRIAVLPDSPAGPFSDQAYAAAIEQAFAENVGLEEVAANAVVRIDVGWPRILAWHESGMTCEAKPAFVGEELANWQEDWGESFSADRPKGMTEGLIELQFGGVSGAAFGLLVKERVRSHGNKAPGSLPLKFFPKRSG